MTTRRIPFNWPYLTGNELDYIAQSHASGKLAGDGAFTKKCSDWLRDLTGSPALLTHSCTAALEMAALLLDVEPGDEVIMPSYTFVSTANAFVLRGATPVFVDIRTDTLNLDERLIEDAVTDRTRAIVPVHYAGVACEMDSILSIAERHSLQVVEDAAQGLLSTYKGCQLGSLGDFGAFSFHETKNIISGEGGALIVNRDECRNRAEIIREKGTNRSQFFRGEVDKYSWQDVGSSFLPGEIIAAFLWAQLEKSAEITRQRIDSWNYYHAQLAPLEASGALRRPIIPDTCVHNGHLYYVLFPDEATRDRVMGALGAANVSSVFHYVPLHSSPAGQRFGRPSGSLAVTEDVAARLLRLPLWNGISQDEQETVVDLLNRLCA